MLEMLCKFFCSSSGTSDNFQFTLREVLKEGGIGVVSASCCAPMAAEKDDELTKNVKIALNESGHTTTDLKVISITDAQKALPRINSQLVAAEQRLVSQIQNLVSTNGFSIFPILIIDRKIAFYGGIPTPEMIKEKLDKPRMPLS